MIKCFTITLLLVSNFSFAADIMAQLKCTPDSNVFFVARGTPKAIRIEGKPVVPNCLISVDKLIISGTFEVDLNELKTGIQTRDDHMKTKYLEVQKYPKAVLTLEPLTINSKTKDTPFTGMLSLHGVQKKVSGTTNMQLVQLKLSGDAKTQIKLSDFAITIPSFAGITVAEDVNIDIKIVAQ